MTKIHCDNCDAIMPEKTGRLWPSKLPTTNVLRNISAEVKFIGPKKEVDLCRTCTAEFFSGVDGIAAAVTGR